MELGSSWIYFFAIDILETEIKMLYAASPQHPGGSPV